jgi:microcystin-dependent protein
VADSYTANLALTKPEIGASRDSWGSKTNANWDVVDEFIQMSMPVGAIIDYAGPNPPPGWMACDGRSVSRTTYSELFAAIGTAWGAGDGSTTFNLPPASGRAAVGAGSVTDANGTARSYAFAQRVGSLSYSILQANLPNISLTTNVTGTHNHTGPTTAAGSHAHTTDAQGYHTHGGGLTGVAGWHGHTGVTDPVGDHAHIVGLYAFGAGAAGGGYSIMSDAFGGQGYATSANGSHAHNLNTTGAGDHTHTINGDGTHTHNVSAVGDHAHYIQYEGDHSHTVSLGGSGARLEVVQPVMVVSKIIYAGSQAAVAVTTAAVPLVRRLMAAPMRGTH